MESIFGRDRMGRSNDSAKYPYIDRDRIIILISPYLVVAPYEAIPDMIRECHQPIGI